MKANLLPPEVLMNTGHDWAIFQAPLDPKDRPFMPGEVYYYERNNGITTWIKPFDYIMPPKDEAFRVGEQWRKEEIERRLAETRKKAKLDKPISQTQIADSLWSCVDTEQGRVYYYNKETKVSCWDKPDEVAELETRMADDEDAVEGTEMNVEDAEWMLTEMGEAIDEEMSEEDEQAAEAEKQPKLSKDERISEFRQMLVEANVNPFGTWDMQLDRFLGDPRYLLIETDEERQDMFDAVCREVIERRRQETKQPKATMAISKPSTPMEPFDELLHEKVTKKMSFAKFCQRNLKDPRYLSLKTSRDREKRFLKHLDALGLSK
ncbi:hypothetical protein GGI25_005569 [Coemansia spiralis]|uniref:WW domain-containing protein n=2 Tax=Coemansia TaxID=4863 RepID=A0A9W8FYE3_9FUNG|nr:hypothetical protein BX070DRAFT_231413 [Coemansia spiralis]KAJ1987813.1 hypothetical protein EDC05_005646 [Coemansia umbellata]KAJ2619450.1 hypothetical protein GGI26_005815 [Coemansia sp. RSA 1358]KAJ2671204.1 hypothetical protein GGI25_005569 [Coemansia spiralis]